MLDLDEDIPLAWRRVALALLSYILFFTDIPRSGYGYSSMPTGYFQVSPTSATFFGPYNYSVADLMRSNDGHGIAFGLTSTATVWSYKFDSCSIGMRAIVQWYNTPHWSACLLYKEKCDGSTLNAETLFVMLDSLVETIRLIPQTTSFRVTYRFDDMLDDYTTFGLFQRKQRRTVQSLYMVEPHDLCFPRNEHRPNFCEMSWYNFNSLGMLHVEMVFNEEVGNREVSVLSSHIQTRMTKSIATLNQTNQRVDVVVIDSTMQHEPWIGSITSARGASFDIVTIMRIQNCTDIAKINCTTVHVQDYRYEGGFNSTNIPRWYPFVRMLRFLGQSYNIIRVIFLVVGCYFARVVEEKYVGAAFHQKVWATIATFFRIPVQVAIYGSWLPVVLFVLAHTVDSSELYFCIANSFVALDGNTQTTPGHLVYLLTMLTCHMRNVWVLCIAVKLISFFKHKNLDTDHLRFGLFGVRGYLLPFVSVISMVLDIRSKAMRNVDILSISPILTSLDTAMLRYEHPLSHYRLSGIYADVKNLAISFVIARVFLLVLCIRNVQYRTRVPHCALSFCNHTMFSTSWSTLLLTISRQTDTVSTIDQFARRSDHLLMNILWMTDPIERLSLIWTSPRVHCYCHKQTKIRIHHPLASHYLERLESFIRLKEEYDCEPSSKFNNLTWRERIECF